MIILAIETVTDTGSVAVLDGERLLQQTFLNGAMKHARDLIPKAQELLKQQGLNFSDVELIGVDVGPGSYTGMRVGVTTAKGLSFSLKKPVAGVVSLEAMAFNVARQFQGKVVPALDAKWKQIYFGIYENSKPIVKAGITPPAEITAIIPEGAKICGDAFKTYPQHFEKFEKLPDEFSFPYAADVGILASRKFAAGTAEPPEPLYLRASEAEENLKRTPRTNL